MYHLGWASAFGGRVVVDRHGQKGVNVKSPPMDLGGNPERTGRAWYFRVSPSALCCAKLLRDVIAENSKCGR
jgi:hypothetical protein